MQGHQKHYPIYASLNAQAAYSGLRLKVTTAMKLLALTTSGKKIYISSLQLIPIDINNIQLIIKSSRCCNVRLE